MAEPTSGPGCDGHGSTKDRMGTIPTWLVLWLGVTPVVGVCAAATIPGRLTWGRGLLGALAGQLAVSAAILVWGWDLFGDPTTGTLLPPPATPAEQALFLLQSLPWTLVAG